MENNSFFDGDLTQWSKKMSLRGGKFYIYSPKTENELLSINYFRFIAANKSFKNPKYKSFATCVDYLQNEHFSPTNESQPPRIVCAVVYSN